MMWPGLVDVSMVTRLLVEYGRATFIHKVMMVAMMILADIESR